MVGPNGPIRDLKFEEYGRYAPPQCLDGDFIASGTPPPVAELGLLRTLLRDPCLCVWKKRGAGWLIGRLEKVLCSDGSVVVTVRQLAFPEHLGPAAIDDLAARSSVFVNVDEAFGAQLARIEREKADRIEAARAESDEIDWRTRILPALAARGAHNRPYEDRAAAMKRADAALDEVGGDWDRVSPEAVGIRMGVRGG